MEIAILNKRDREHCICRLTGEQITISPNGFYIINTQDEREINYWLHLNVNVLNRCGLEVSINDDCIRELKNTHPANTKTSTDVSVVDTNISPIVQEIAKITYSNEPETDDTVIQKEQPEFSEEQLLKMDREDLIAMCDNFNISYRRNASVRTLANLIIGSGVL